MAISYTFNRVRNYYLVKNTDTQNIVLEVFKNFCGEGTSILPYQDRIVTVAPNNSTYLAFDTDGNYTLKITKGSEQATVPFTNYQNLLVSMVKDVEREICNCGCSGCDGDDDNCPEKISLLAKLVSYQSLTQPENTIALGIVGQAMQCSYQDELLCALSREYVKGDRTTIALFNKIVLTYYLAFYFQAKIAAQGDVQVLQWVNETFRTNTILPCVRKNCVDMDALEDLFSQQGNLSIVSGVYVNQPPSSVGNKTLNVANRATTVITLAMLTTGTTPPYADPENDGVANLRINTISNSNVGVFKFNGNPITVGQVISAAQINSGLLVHHSPDQNAGATDSFTFSLSDTGSELYTPL